MHLFIVRGVIVNRCCHLVGRQPRCKSSTQFARLKSLVKCMKLSGILTVRAICVRSWCIRKQVAKTPKSVPPEPFDTLISFWWTSYKTTLTLTTNWYHCITDVWHTEMFSTPWSTLIREGRSPPSRRVALSKRWRAVVARLFVLQWRRIILLEYPSMHLRL